MLNNYFSDKLFSFSKGSNFSPFLLLIALWFLLVVLNPLPQKQNLKSIPTCCSLETGHSPPPFWLPWAHFLWKPLEIPRSKRRASHGPGCGFTWVGVPCLRVTCCLCLRQLCGKEFNRMHNLMGHMHLHSDSKPFKCLYCPSKFTLKGNLTRHMKVKHGVMERGLHSQGINLPRSPLAWEASG